MASIYLKVLSFAAALTAAGAAFAQAAKEGFDQRHKDLLARDDLQFAFIPSDEVAAPPPQPSLFGWLDDFLDAIAPVFTWLF